MKKILLLSLIILFSNTIIAQNKKVPNPKYPSLFKTIPPIATDAPRWVQLMYSQDVNFNEVQKAFDAYYKDQVLKKNTHTQNYKYFVEQVLSNNYLQEDGTIFIPNTKEEYNNKVNQLLNERGITSTINTNSVQRSSYAANSWTAIGPFETYSGTNPKSSQANVYVFEQSLSNSNTLYASTDTNGLFKSTDKGLNWFPIGDDYFTSDTVSALGVDPTDENTIYVGRGRKLHKSTDGGSTWQELLDEYNLSLNAIIINPNNTQTIIIGGNSGVKRSTDGGTTWTTIYTDKCWDIKFKTNDPNTVFLLKSNTTKNITEFYKSTDNGITFTLKDTGWFAPINGTASSNGGARMGVTDADSNRIYVVLLGNEDDAIEDNNYIGIYRSNDAGESWSTPYDGDSDGAPDNEPGGPYSDNHWCLSGFNVTSTGYDQGYYDLDIAVSDTDADKFLVGFLNLYKSENGGTSYTKWGGYQCDGCGAGYRHPDIQEIEINGSDVWVASDGGLDYYDANLNYIESRKKGINAANYWGFGQGWNEDVLVGGRYHNGNAGYYQTYGVGNFISLGGGEAATGYVNQGENRKVYHSDLGSAKLLPLTLTGTVGNISNYSIFPNQHYITNAKSELITNPNYWNTLYLGKDNKLWKSIDGGNTFSLVHTFGTNSTNIVMSIEISRNDSNLMYITQKYNGLWKTTDGGTTWTQVTIPASTSVMYISINTNDELYLVLTNGYSNTNKAFKTIDGGTTWANLTSTALNGVRLRDLCVQNGTDGGVYVSSGQSFWYRNNSMADWQVFSTGLPLTYNSRNIMVPFYKESKIRSAGNKGIWERDFYEDSTPTAQPMVKNKNISCYLDEIQFEDYSILDHNGASWSWSFPGASYVSSTTVRNPIVKYPSYGSYDVTLTVTDAQGHSDSKTITNFIQVGNNCSLSNLDSDNDTLLDAFENSICTMEIPQSSTISSGESLVISNFEGDLTGTYNAELNFYTDCSNKSASLKATIDLDNQTILVYSYSHFDSTNTTDAILNNNSNEVSSASSNFSKIAIQLMDNSTTGEKNLVFKLISNACGTTAQINLSCLGNLDYDSDGIANYLDTDSDNDGLTDTVETQPCGTSIATSSYFGSGEERVAIAFGTVTSGIFYTTTNVKTNCYGVIASLKARIDLDQQTITVITYNHFTSTSNDAVIGNGTNEVMSGSTSYARPKFKLVYDNVTNTFTYVVEQISNACGAVLRIDDGSCWSSLDTDSNGFIDYLDNPTLSVSSTNNYSKIIAYPNPVNNQMLDFLNLNTSYSFKLYSISGKELFKKEVQAGEKINLEHLASGTYIYQIETNDKILNGKIIKQ